MTRLRFLVAGLLVALPVTACGGSAADSTTTPGADSSTSAAAAAGPEATYVGAWFGYVPAGYRVQLQFEPNPDGGLTGVLDSIDEGVMGLPMDYVTASEDGITFTVANTPIGGTFSFDDDGRLAGALEADGEEQAIVLVRRDPPFAFDRPQEPRPPYPYASEDVRFPGGNGDYELAGSLTVPAGEGPFPAVLLISGSGPQGRDEQVAGHRPFLLVADHLTRAGMAVLRYDDPGYAESGGSLDGTTEDLADDAAAAFRYLAGRPETDVAGLLGHSEGALIAPMVAATEAEVAFIVMLAGPATAGSVVLAEQTALVVEAEGAPPEIVAWQTGLTRAAISASASGLDDDTLDAELLRIATEAGRSMPDLLAAQMTTDDLYAELVVYREPWMRYFLAYDPAPALAALDIPVLALFGSVDVQVAAGTNAPAMTDLLTHPSSEVEVVPGANHLFQTSETGRVSEYADLTETMSPAVLDRLTSWILSIVA